MLFCIRLRSTPQFQFCTAPPKHKLRLKGIEKNVIADLYSAILYFSYTLYNILQWPVKGYTLPSMTGGAVVVGDVSVPEI